jgi:hypothetical protein
LSPLRPKLDTFRRHFVDLYNQASPEDKAAGQAWYATAQETAALWAVASGRSLENIAALIAVLSPQCDWDRNLAAAFALLNDEAVGQGPLPVNVDKARRVLAENLTDTRIVMPSGNKVAAFAANIAGDMDAVTIDTHMTEAAHCSIDARPFPKDAAYQVYADAIRLAADEAADSPAMLQAVVWIVWKRLHAPGAKRTHRRSE